eukprot:CAMPEP_0178620336 /NCGR_PEP_ID=MMETSP0698-20121128/5232_1 /TAXON_ID=265572 /ORGANISM="Extubocellulus spinifer, Strain CCMP396" /LENGTH=95 /DNA_ID=CAMNT_0020259309 /DNA_START=1458 /DNA_END=1742 /DNA_ORIENTATION=+
MPSSLQGGWSLRSLACTGTDAGTIDDAGTITTIDDAGTRTSRTIHAAATTGTSTGTDDAGTTDAGIGTDYADAGASRTIHDDMTTLVPPTLVLVP